MLCLSEVYEVNQCYKNQYGHTLHEHRDIAGIHFKFSPQTVHHTNSAEGLTRAILINRSGCQKILKSISVLPVNLSLPCLKQNILETVTDTAKKLSSVPREGNRDYFVAQIGIKSLLKRFR